VGSILKKVKEIWHLNIENNITQNGNPPVIMSSTIRRKDLLKSKASFQWNQQFSTLKMKTT